MSTFCVKCIFFSFSMNRIKNILLEKIKIVYSNKISKFIKTNVLLFPYNEMVAKEIYFFNFINLFDFDNFSYLNGTSTCFPNFCFLYTILLLYLFI